MNNTDGILVRKRISVLNKEIKVSFKDLVKSLGKALVDFNFGNWDRLGKDGFEALAALGLESDPGYIAWLLIFRSLNRAIHKLVEENKELFTSKYKNFDETEDKIYDLLEEKEITIDRSFFNHPKDLSILKDIETPFKEWLQLYGLNEAQATSIYNHLPSYFVFALNQEWRERRSEYLKIQEEINTPFTKPQEIEKSWSLYSSWLQKQVDEPMFLEAFSLKQVYVEPRAYFYQKDDKSKQYEKVVVDLHNHLENWLSKADQDDAIRIINGDPGAGKSSFAKMFASELAEKGEIPILFIPLHLFDPTGDLVDAVSKFIKDDDYLSYNPLDGELKEPRLLIIFDGVDELSMSGKLGAEVAESFIKEVKNKVRSKNRYKTNLQVIISGRPVVIQSNQYLVKLEQILHILPYLVSKNEINKYQYRDNLLREDRRNRWWQKYGEVTGENYTEMPDELKLDSLFDITTQPLLNYLIAFSYQSSKKSNDDAQDKIIFSEENNLNTIYDHLLKSVYKRDWDTAKKHRSLEKVEDYESEFVRILEEIALSAWHGNVRTTTVKEIEAHCQNSDKYCQNSDEPGKLEKLLEKFKEQAKNGATKHLTIFHGFYFGKSERKDSENETFEFTHKSFAEYLTARRIVRELIKINKELKNRDNDLDEGWDEKQALTRWAMVCGMSAIDQYLFEFICNEIALQDQEKVKQWQQTLSNLISFMLRQGMPMENIVSRPSYKEECRQSRNAEEALLVVLNACARYTQERSKIEWQSEYSFGKWLSRLQNHIEDNQKIIVNKCFIGINLEKANLEKAKLAGANLAGANLVEANLVGANLAGAKMDEKLRRKLESKSGIKMNRS